MSGEHRQIATDWHIEPMGPLQEFARTGSIGPGLDEEIRECLASIERGELGDEFDPVEEHARLLALLRHVEPELAKGHARELGRQHGQAAAAWWQQDALGGRATCDTAATARRVLQGLEDGDPSILNSAPGWDQVVTPAEIAAESGWPEPDIDNRAAHDRWNAAQFDLCDAYATAFVDAYWTAVAASCRDELAKAPAEISSMPPREGSKPFLRNVEHLAFDQAPVADAQLPAGWLAEPAGYWNGRPSEVVYDARRYSVMFLWTKDPELTGVLEADGWQQRATDGTRAFWIRDRWAATRAALGRFDRTDVDADRAAPARAGTSRSTAPRLERD